MDRLSFFKKAQPAIVPVTVADETYYVKHLGITELLSFESVNKERKQEDNIGEVLIACVCDEHGNNLLTADDADSLKHIDAGVAIALYKSALKLNQIDDTEIDTLKKTEQQPAPALYLSDGAE